jgi:hypothetical protein
MSPEEPSPSARVENLRREIQQLVAEGIESPCFELTRKCSLASGDKKSQTDFVKTIQGMANAYPPIERSYVIGADQKEKKFFPIEKPQEFDSANVRQILEKYLEPLPSFETQVMETDDAIKFAAVVLAAEQPRPIVVRAQAGDDRTQFLQIGEIWVKKNTGLTRANREDLEKIYETRIEAEAERRAARRFADTRNGLEASFRLQFSPERRIPSSDLVFGPDAEYKAYIELLFANQDWLRFRMLVTTIRDLLIEAWHSIGADDSETPSMTMALEAKVAIHFHSAFQPALRRLVYAGLLLIKFEVSTDWFGHAADLLIEVLTVCNIPNAPAGLGAKVSDGSILKGTVALDVLLSARLLAAYATRMEQYQYLSTLLRKWVIPVSSSITQKREPLLFWPLRMSVPGHDRVAFLWNDVVQPYWLDFFGSKSSYLDAACRLEFILHMNSYLATENPEGSRWTSQYRPNVDFGYWYTSDLWRYRLDPVVPLTEQIYENLAEGPNAAFLLDLSIEHTVFQKAFQPSEQSLSGHGQQIFIAYLKKLAAWQSQAAFSSGHFPYQTDWGPILSPYLAKK